MKVLKFGGTSIGQPERMKGVAQIAEDQEGAKIIVLSALSGTTNSLVKIGEFVPSSVGHYPHDCRATKLAVLS